ncbi:diguanylate cyclase [Alishewanella sp. HH-ZS]|uniref:GGDEF domain-containing protein n=1 Tax=Alishewanella sp. HH-ZS TaxID=1856684 RepID=UPI00082373DF|nr:GGDEF domain-containing protein [Alishewanella sp. HH-ZS]OCW97336.1 hypothetical protein A9165_07255 [Alishewanella sp. HH-ZS]
MQTPTDIQQLIAFLMLLLVVSGAGWAVMAWLVKICPKASKFFALAHIQVLLGMLLLQQRTEAAAFWYWQLSDLLILSGFFSLYLGIAKLYTKAIQLQFEVLLAASCLLAYLLLIDGPASLRLGGVVFSLVSMAIFARCAQVEWQTIRQSFGQFYAGLFAAPLCLFSLFFLWRSLDTLLQPNPSIATLSLQSSESAKQLWFFIVLILIMNLNLVGYAISRLVSKIRQLADKDLLTGVWSRRIIMQQLEYYLRDSKRNQRPFTVLLLDLDHFKQLNDQYGHACGDQALQAATQVLQQQLRQGDWLGRFGGEEFVVILPDTVQAQALEIAERLRLTLAETAMPAPIARALTVSIGVAEHHSGQSVPELLEQADQAMYRAKASGRNAVYCANTR